MNITIRSHFLNNISLLMQFQVIVGQVTDLVVVADLVDGHSAVEVNVLRRMQVGVDLIVTSFMSSLDAKGT
jgi:hypothetical protein